MKQYLDLMREVRRRASSRKTALGPPPIAPSIGKCVSTWWLIFHRRNKALVSQQFPEQPQRCGLVALRLDQHLENLGFVVDRTPQVHLPSSD